MPSNENRLNLPLTFEKSTLNDQLDYKAEKWLAVGFIAFVSSFIWSPSRDGLEVVYILFFLFPLGYLFFKRKAYKTINIDLNLVLIFIFCVYATITALWNTPKDIFFLLLQLFLISTWITGAFWLVRENKINLLKLFSILIFIGSIASVITIIEFYGIRSQSFNERLTCWCSAKNSNLIGGVYGILALMSYAFLITEVKLINKLKYFTFFILLVMPLAFSQSRASLLAFLVSIIGALLIIRPKIWIVIFQLFLAILMALVSTILLSPTKLLESRLMSGGERDLIWSEIYNQLFERFFFGIGLSKDTKTIIPGVDVFNHTHNSWLDTFYRTGFIGFLLISLITFTIVKKSLSLKSIEGKILFLWILFGVITLTFDHRILFWQIDTKWFFYWIPAPLIIGLYKKHSLLEKTNVKLK